MDALTFTSNAIDSLAWPLVVVAVVVLLRKELKTLLSLLRKLKAGPVEAEFEREALDVREDAEALVPGLVPQRVRDQTAVASQLATTSPRAAIISAWQGVEAALNKLAAQLDLPAYGESRRRRIDVLSAISRSGMLQPEQMSLLYELRSLRNEAVHSLDREPSLASALNFIEAAARLQSALEGLVS